MDKEVRKMIKDCWGNKCSTYCPSCPICRAYKDLEQGKLKKLKREIDEMYKWIESNK